MFSNYSIYSAEPGLVIGFHGCEKSVRDSIVEGKTMLKISRNNYDWLGFAMNPPGKGKYAEPAVLGAILSLGNCLDLSDKRCIDMVGKSYCNLMDSFPAEHKELLKNRDVDGGRDKILRELDCAVIEHMHGIMERSGESPFDSLRGIFIEGKPIYNGAGFYEKTHVQICIRNPDCIKGFFIPRKEKSASA